MSSPTLSPSPPAGEPSETVPAAPPDIAPAELEQFRRLLKALWRYRIAAASSGLATRLLHRWHRGALLARLEAEWPGGAVQHRTGDFVFVPRPLDARGLACLLHPPHAHAAALGFVPAGGVVVDVGANLGEWTLPLARAIGHAGTVLAFEPMPRIARALAETMRLNNLRQVEIVVAAASDQPGRARLAVPVVSSRRVDTGRAHLGAPGAGEEAVEVATLTLDAALAARQVRRLDLIKIDVEGHERAVLAGAADSIRRFHPVIVIESGHEAPGDRAAILAQLGGAGYELAGILLDYGVAKASWEAYQAGGAPFAAGEVHNLLLLPPRGAGAAPDAV